jgi:aminoglycoside phosphotransferase (APT) family kinase protein
VLKVIFDDEETWVCRIQVPVILRFNSKQRAAHEDGQMKAMTSQLGSLRYVKTHTKIPVPTIYGFDIGSDNAAGAPYMFMELAQGMSLRKWLEENILTKEKATHFYKQLADIMWEFYRTRFNKIGELRFDKDDNLEIGGFFDSRTQSTYGPFTSAHEFLTQRQQKLWEYRVLAERRLIPVVDHGRRHWDELNRDEKDVFTAWLYRKAAQYAETEYNAAYPDASPDQISGYILFHADMSVNNMLVDDDLNVTAVIDWDWTSSVPKISFDPLPFDMGYETEHQFPGNASEHEIFNHKELYYGLWKQLEERNDPEGHLGKSLIPIRTANNSIAVILNMFAWTYCVERTCVDIFDKIKSYEPDSCCWRCLISDFRQDWIDTKRSMPGWWDRFCNFIFVRSG